MLNNYSPNMLKTFDECPKKFFLKYIEKISLPQRSAIFEKGKKIHALAHYYLKGFDISKMEKTLSPDEKVAWETLKSNKYFQMNVVNTECQLSCKIGKHWVGGRLDALVNGKSNFAKASYDKLKIENGKEAVSLCETANHSTIHPFTHSTFVILDYKTGSIPKNAEYDFQTIIYLLCADKYLKHRYGSLKFVYLGLKESEEKEIILTPELKSEYEQKIISVCGKIDNAITSMVIQDNIKNCIRCEYDKFCQLL